MATSARLSFSIGLVIQDYQEYCPYVTKVDNGLRWWPAMQAYVTAGRAGTQRECHFPALIW